MGWKTITKPNHIRARRIALLPIMAALLSSPLAADTLHLDPARIDRAVANFTGAAIGAVGGAQHRADPRLRLVQCDVPLLVEWHGVRQRAVKVSCQTHWQIFVGIKSAPQSAPAPDIVRRGDKVTIAIKGSGFAIRRPGEAAQAGKVGEWISVKTDRKAEPISAQIVRPGLVVIPF